MIAIRMAAEEEATGTVKEIYADVRATSGIDFVPNLHRMMATKPGYLKAIRSKV